MGQGRLFKREANLAARFVMKCRDCEDEPVGAIGAGLGLGCQSMGKPAVAASGFTDLLNTPPNTSAAWDAFSLFVVKATPAQATGAFADHALGLYVSGRHRIRREMAGRPIEGWSDPGTVNLTPANVKATWLAGAASRVA